MGWLWKIYNEPDKTINDIIEQERQIREENEKDIDKTSNNEEDDKKIGCWSV